MPSTSSLILLSVLVVASCSLSVASPTTARIALEHVPAVPPGFSQGPRANPDASVDLLFFVKHAAPTHGSDLVAACEAVSDPLGPRYGKFLSAHALEHEVIRAHANREVVEQWLASSGVANVERRGLGDLLRVRVAVRVAESLLDTQFFEFTHDASGHVWLRARAYTVPEHVAPFLQLVGGVVTLVRPMKKGKRLADHVSKFNVGADNPTIVPSVLHAYYEVPDASTVGAVPGNSASVSEFPYGGSAVADEYFIASDLNSFLAYQNLPAQDVNTSGDPNLPGNCALGKQDNCGESMLDIEVLVGVAAGFVPQGNFDFHVTNSNNGTLEHFLEWAEALASAPDGQLPLVHSVSFGDPEYSFSPQYLDAVNLQLCAVAARGASVLVASGDCGVSDSCLNQDCNAPLPVDFPASATYAVAVGGTQITDKGEIVCSADTFALITSGGGFSKHFPAPAFQAPFIADYLSSGVEMPPATYFNSSNAGSPTISFVAHNFFTVVNGRNESGVDGTSASTPTAAGMFTVINAFRLSSGHSPLGWAKPLLYHIASLKLQNTPFNDVTVGNNKFGEGEFQCQYGYNAAPGWDPATGLGSFSVKRMLQALQVVDAQRRERAEVAVM